MMLVTTTAEFDAALKAAKGGDTIQLAPGDYRLDVIERTFNPPLSITSADPSKPANVTTLNAISTVGLNLSRLRLTVRDDGTYNPFTVNQCDGVTVEDCALVGPGLAIKVEASNLFFRNSKNVAAKRCDFSGAVFGLQVLENEGLTVEDCRFHDLRSDGIRGGGNSKVSYQRNLFHSFYPNELDHPDAIQFWTTNVTHPVADIIVRDNVMVRGAGKPFQGVFIRDEDLKLPYSGVTVAGNIVLGGHFNGISFDGVDTGSGTGNVVVGFPDQESYFITRGGGTLDISGNTVSRLVTQADESKDNSVVAPATDGGLALLTAFSASHPVPGGLTSWADVMIAIGLKAAAPATPTPSPTPAPAPSPVKSDILARLTKARLEANNAVNDARRALSALDRAIEAAQAL